MDNSTRPEADRGERIASCLEAICGLEDGASPCPAPLRTRAGAFGRRCRGRLSASRLQLPPRRLKISSGEFAAAEPASLAALAMTPITALQVAAESLTPRASSSLGISFSNTARSCGIVNLCGSNPASFSAMRSVPRAASRSMSVLPSSLSAARSKRSVAIALITHRRSKDHGSSGDPVDVEGRWEEREPEHRNGGDFAAAE